MNMREKRSLFSAGAALANRHKRYIIWFYLLSLFLALCGTGAFSGQMHAALDHSLYSDRLLHGFDVAVWVELLNRPETGALSALTRPATYAMVVFILLTIVFMPGVIAGYIAEARIPREEFYRACGKNLWRFVRLVLFFCLISIPTAAILFGIRAALVKAAENTSNERLPFFVQVIGDVIIFLVLLAIRAWFDLAQTDVVVRNEGRVRKSVAAGFRMLRRNLARVLGTYLLISLVGLVIMMAGMLLWYVVPPASVLAAFLVSQEDSKSCRIPRFILGFLGVWPRTKSRLPGIYNLQKWESGRSGGGSAHV
jgi:hypothetical protein